MLEAVDVPVEARIELQFRELRCAQNGEILSTSPSIDRLVGLSIFGLTTAIGADVIRAIAHQHLLSGTPVRFSLPLIAAPNEVFHGVAELLPSTGTWLIRRLPPT